MLPREKNGVVDADLRVYGTKNIRVADLSIVPLHFASHTQSKLLVTMGISSIDGEIQVSLMVLESEPPI